MDAFNAMMFAREKHASQKRKYTGNPYADHLAEVAGIVAAVSDSPSTDGVRPCKMIATAWLHDVMEDQGVTRDELMDRFGPVVCHGVALLSDMETGNRAERKRLSRERLAKAPAWVQTIKVADMISNTSSIVEHDPDFARVYLREKIALLDVLQYADPRLVKEARHMVWQGLGSDTSIP